MYEKLKHISFLEVKGILFIGEINSTIIIGRHRTNALSVLHKTMRLFFFFFFLL